MVNRDSTQTIVSSSNRFFCGTLISRFSGMLREVVMAAIFGCSPTVAAFLMAFRFSNMLRRLFGEGAMQSSFIPHFEEIRLESPKRSAQFFCNLSLSILIILFFLVLVAEGFLCGMLMWGNVRESNQEIFRLTAIMLPSVFFICLFGLNTSLLQCEKKYFLSSVAPSFFNLIWILSILILNNGTQVNAIKYLSASVVIAYFVQWLFTMPEVIRILSRSISWGVFKDFKIFSRDMIKFKSILFISMIGVGASQLNGALDLIFARMSDLSGPAYLSYSLRLQQLPLALFGIGTVGALLPPLSRAIKSGNIDEYKHFLTFALKRCISILIPCTVMIVILALVIVNVVYGRGDFDNTSTRYTALCLTLYGLGLLPMTLVFLLASAFYACGKYSFPTKISIISVCVNICLNFLFIAVFNMGSASVAAATSISAVVNTVLLLVGLIKQVSTLPLKAILCTSMKVFCISIVVAIFTLIISKYFFGFSGLEIYTCEKFEITRVFFKANNTICYIIILLCYYDIDYS